MNVFQCVLIGTSILISICTVCTLLSVYYPPVEKAVRSKYFPITVYILVLITLALLIFEMLCLILIPWSNHFMKIYAFMNRREFKRIAFIILFLGFTGLVMIASQVTHRKSTVPISLISVIVLFSILAYIGIKIKKPLFHWGPRLFSILSIVMIASLLNIFLFKADWLDTTISAVSIVLFSFYVVYNMRTGIEMNRALYTNFEFKDGKFHLTPPSDAFLCELGMMDLWVDFINLVFNVMNITDKYNK